MKFIDDALYLQAKKLIEEMERFEAAGSKDTPKIILDKGTGIYRITGRSYPEDADVVNQEVFAWFHKYREAPQANTEVVINLEYFNTATGKVLVELLSELNTIKGLTVTWHCHPDDDDMRETIEQIAALAEVKIQLGTG